MSNVTPRVQPIAGRDGWLTEAQWKRLRQALDDGIGRGDLARRFGLADDTLRLVVSCRTLDEARAALSAKAKRSRRKSA